jgi:hypothetical protein
MEAKKKYVAGSPYHYNLPATSVEWVQKVPGELYKHSKI